MAGKTDRISVDVVQDASRVLRCIGHPVRLRIIELLDNRGELNVSAVQEALELVVLMLSPVVPHICHALWHALGHTGAIVDCRWPSFDADALVQDTITLIVQVNGKLRGKVSVAADAQREAIEAAVLNEENVCRHIGEQPVKKFIVVPGKLVNVVI